MNLQYCEKLTYSYINILATVDIYKIVVKRCDNYLLLSVETYFNLKKYNLLFIRSKPHLFKLNKTLEKILMCRHAYT